MPDIYVDGDACPVREKIYRVAMRLKVEVFVVSSGSCPIRPPGMSNVSMVLVGDTADAADDWIVARIGAADVCVTSDIPLASRCLKKGARVVSPIGKQWTEANIGNALAGLGFTGIGEVRQGKLIELELEETDAARARERVEAMCRELLANPVIEDYRFEIESQ